MQKIAVVSGNIDHTLAVWYKRTIRYTNVCRASQKRHKRNASLKLIIENKTNFIRKRRIYHGKSKNLQDNLPGSFRTVKR